MTDDGGQGEGPDGAGTEGPGGEGVRPDLRELDAELRGVRFRPRAGLEDDVLARIAGHSGRRRRRTRTSGWPRAARAAVAVLALVAVLGLLDGAGPDRAGPGGGVAAGPADADVPYGWAVQWGPDARVLALGAATSPGRRASGRGLWCGRVDSRIRCRGADPGGLPARAEQAEGGAVLRDFCCLDYDGGGAADDGVRVVAGRDEAVADFWIYEDRDGTGSFSDGDLLRTVVPGVPPAGGATGVPAGARRLDRCCADLDGGPHADDGVFVMAGGRERVALAVLYEDENGDGRLSPGDRLRAVRTEDGSTPGDEGTEGVR